MPPIAAPGRRVPTPGLHPGHPTPDLTIYTLGALAGAGKTFAIDRHALDLAPHGANVCIVQPTRELIAQTVHDLRTEEARRREKHPSRAPLPIRAITSDTTTNVSRDLVEHLKRPDDGQVLLITHAAFFGCPHWHRKPDWTVIVDEVPPVIFAKELNLSRNHHLLTDAIAVEAGDVLYGRVVARDDALLREIARNRSGDQADALVQDIAERVASGHWDVDVIEAQYRRLLSGGVVDGEEATRGTLHVFGVLRPSVFRDYGQVIVAGACFEASLMYHLWAGRGVAFKPHAKLHKALRYRTHGNGHRLTLYYATERPWSKHLRDKVIELVDGKPYTVLDDLVERSRALFADAAFCWLGNVDLPDGLFGPWGKRLPNNPVGLNRYQDLHDVAVVSALNPTPAQYRHLEDRGVDGEAVRTWLYRHAAYQALMRTSLRDAAATAPARAVVADLGCAEWLAGLFPGAKIEPLPGGRGLPAPGRRGRPRVHADDAARRAAKDADAGARMAEHRRRTRDRLLGHLRVLNGVPHPSGDDREHEAKVWDDMREGRGVVPGTVPEFVSPDGHTIQELAGTLCAGKHGHPMAWLRHDGTEAFIRMLRACHDETIAGKEQAGLYSPAIFDPDVEFLPDAKVTRRGYANVLAVRGIWLDFDGGDLGPEELARVLPRCRITAFNTHSNTAAERRWRAFLPTDGLMSVAVHGHVLRQIVHALNRHGWFDEEELEQRGRAKTKGRHGLDASKVAATSLFYLPSQAAVRSASFFVDYDGPERRPFDLFRMVDRGVVHDRPEPAVAQGRAVVASKATACLPEVHTTGNTSPGMAKLREALAAQGVMDRCRYWTEQAIEEWAVAPGGEGNRRFFRLGLRLRNAGWDLPDVRRILEEQAWNARTSQSRVDRRDQIPSIVDWLRQNPKRY